MRKIILILVICSVFIASEESILKERIVAVVSESPILLTEVEMAVLVETGGEIPQDSLAYQNLIREKIQQMIDEKLLLEAAIIDSIIVTDDFLDQQFQERWNQFKQGFANEEMISTALAQEGYTLPGFKRQMRENLEEMILKQQFIEKKFGNIEVNREYVDSFYHKYKDSIPERPRSVRLAAVVLEEQQNLQILDSLRKIALEISEEIDDKTDFEEIGQKLEEKYPTLGVFSGKLGTFKRGDLHHSLDSTAFSINIGSISGIVKSPNGFHILKKVDGNSSQATLEHITVPIPEKSDEGLFEEYVNMIYERLIENPDSFEAFVELYSVDPVSKDQKGDIGHFELNQLEEGLRRSIENANEGDILPPVIRNKQADIFKLTEYEESRTLNIDDDYDMLREMAIQNKKTELLQSYLDRIRDEVYIDIRY